MPLIPVFRRLYAASVCAGILLAGSWVGGAVAAQRTTGEILGKVTDTSGRRLPGVTVTLRGPAMQGEPTTVTSETGVYRFPTVPPGTYEVEYTLSGFTHVEAHGNSRHRWVQCHIGRGTETGRPSRRASRWPASRPSSTPQRRKSIPPTTRRWCETSPSSGPRSSTSSIRLPGSNRTRISARP